MKFIRYLLVVILQVGFCAVGQCQPLINKYFSKPGGETLQSGFMPFFIEQSQDSGFVLIGSKGTGIESSAHILIKTWPDGTVRFSKQFHGNSSPRRAAQLSDGGLLWPANILGGLIYMDPLMMGYARFDSAGQQLWRYVYVPDTAQYQPSYVDTYSGGSASLELPNGEIMLSGLVKVSSQNPWQVNNQKSLLVRIDSSGNVLQSMTFSSSLYNLSFAEIHPTPDGGYLVSGTSIDPLDYYSLGSAVFKFDQQFNLVWAKRYFNQTSEYLTGLTILPDGDFLMKGAAGDNKMFLRRADSTGTVEWTKEYDGVVPFYPGSVVNLPDSTFYVSGTLANQGPNFLMHVAQGGAIISATADTSQQLFGGLAVTKTNVNEWAVLSRSAYQLPNTQYNYHYLRLLTFGSGQLPFQCGAGSAAITVNSAPVSVSNLTVQQDTLSMIKLNHWTTANDAQLAATDTLNCQVVTAFNNYGTEIHGLDVSPNPAAHHITFEVKEILLENSLSLVVYSVTGSVQHSQALSSNSTKVNCASWAPGIYFYRITNAAGKAVNGKFIVTR